MAKRKAKQKKKTKPKNKGGRPKEKVSDKIDYDQLAFLCQKGATDVELAHFFGKAKSTINRWKKSADFKKVLDANKAMADDIIEHALFERAKGMQMGEGAMAKIAFPDVEAIKFWLMNRRGKKWRIKQEIDIPGTIKVEFPYRKNPKGKG